MALSELPVNHIRRNGRTVETPPDSLLDDSRYPQTPSNGAKAGFMPTPSSIQSMLKNTTEIGDIGQLAFPSRGPKKPRMNDVASHPLQQTPPPRPSGSIRSSARKQHQKGGAYRQPSDRGTPYSAMRSQPGTVSGASSIYSMYRNRSETSFRSQSRAPSRGPSQGPEGIDELSYFTVPHSRHDRNFAGHPVHPNSRLRSQAELHNMRPKSPFAYPTRLKRPGYRPSSPALSEAYRSAARSPYGFQRATTNRGTSFRTISPLSMYSVGMSPTVWQPGQNRSDPMLSRQQLSPKEQYSNGQYFQNPHNRRIDHPRVITRTSTPVPPGMYRSIEYVSTIEASVPPLFYDYSEDFQQESFYYASDSVPVFHDAQTTSRNNNERSYYELDTGNEDCSELYIAELPADVPSSRRKSARGSQSNGQNANASVQVESVPKRSSHSHSIREAATRSGTLVLEQANLATKRSSYAHLTRETAALSPLGATDDAKADIQENDKMSQTGPSIGVLEGNIERQSRSLSEAPRDPPSVRDTIGHRILSSYKRSQEFLAGAPNRTIGNANISLYSRRSRSSSSSAGSMYSVQSASHPDHDREPGADLGAAEASLHMQVEIPSSRAKAQKPSFDAGEAVRPQTAHTEIHSPIPKRSMSSPSHRERFSSILSIDENLPELDEIAGKPKRQTKASITSIFAKADRTTSRPEPSLLIPIAYYSSPKLHDISEAQARTPNVHDHGTLPNDARNHLVNEEGHRKEATASDAKRAFEHLSDTTSASSITVPFRTFKTSKPAISLFDPPTRKSSGSQLDDKPAMRSETSATGGNRSKPHTMKELPLRPRSSLISFAPPPQRESVALPFSFTPLRPDERDHDADSVTELGKIAASYLNQSERFGSEPSNTPPKTRPKLRSDQTSLVLSIRSRPGQVHAEDGKAEQSPKVELSKPEPAKDSHELSPSKMPRFKLKVHRASSSTAGTMKIAKPRPSAEAGTRPSKDSGTVRRLLTLHVVPFANFSNSSMAVLPLELNRSPKGLNLSSPLFPPRTTVADRAQSRLALWNHSTYHRKPFRRSRLCLPHQG